MNHIIDIYDAALHSERMLVILLKGSHLYVVSKTRNVNSCHKRETHLEHPAKVASYPKRNFKAKSIFFKACDPIFNIATRLFFLFPILDDLKGVEVAVILRERVVEKITSDLLSRVISA